MTLAQYFIEDNLQAIESRLRLNQYIVLRKIKTWKLGVLPPVSVFPAIAILPISEVPYSYSSGGLYKSKRSFAIEVYNKGFPKEAVEKSNFETVNGVENALRHGNFRLFEGQSFDAKINRSVAQIQSMSDGKSTSYIVNGIINLDLYCRNEIVSSDRLTVEDSTYSYEKNSSHSYSLLLKLKKLFTDLREPGLYNSSINISECRVIEKSGMPVNTVFPSIMIVEPDYNIDRKYAGQDQDVKHFEIHVLTRALPQEEHLLTNLRLTTKLQRILHLYPYLRISGNSSVDLTPNQLIESTHRSYITNTVITGVKYEISKDYSLYQSIISIDVLTRKRAIL